MLKKQSYEEFKFIIGNFENYDKANVKKVNILLENIQTLKILTSKLKIENKSLRDKIKEKSETIKKFKEFVKEL